MPAILASVRLASTTGFERDVVINTFALDAADGIDAELFIEPFSDFYNAFNTLLGQTISRAALAHDVELAEITLVGGTLGAAVLAGSFTLAGSPPAESLPQEVALCSSIVAAEPGVSLRRRRGRVYLGPWSIGASDAGPDGAGRPQASLVEAVANATQQLQDDLEVLGAPLCVWSRADQVLREVTGGWVDNEWDTMRSRELRSTNRETWGLV